LHDCFARARTEAHFLEGAERAANQVLRGIAGNVAIRDGGPVVGAGSRKEVGREGILRDHRIEGGPILKPFAEGHATFKRQPGGANRRVVGARLCNKVRPRIGESIVCGGRAERLARHDYELLRQGRHEKIECATEDLVSAAAPRGSRTAREL